VTPQAAHISGALAPACHLCCKGLKKHAPASLSAVEWHDKQVY